MKVVVTGGSGRLGAVVVRELLTAGHTVTNVDRTAPSESQPGVTFIEGSLHDQDLVASALDSAGAVVHLAAIASPGSCSDHELFVNNTVATFTVLDTAAQAGVTRAVVASSISVLGLAWAPGVVEPPTMPVLEDAPLQVSDAYALGKQVDEAIAEMISRRSGMTILAYRFPDMGDGPYLLSRGRTAIADPSHGARELWAYLHFDDAARAVLLGLTAHTTGAATLNVVAEDSLGGVDVEHYARTVFDNPMFRRPIPAGRTAYDTSKSQALLGFASRIRWDAEESVPHNAQRI